MTKNSYTFETALKRVEEISALLSTPQTSLDESLSYYKEASELLLFCNEALAKAKLEIEEVTLRFNDEL